MHTVSLDNRLDIGVGIFCGLVLGLILFAVIFFQLFALPVILVFTVFSVFAVSWLGWIRRAKLFFWIFATAGVFTGLYFSPSPSALWASGYVFCLFVFLAALHKIE